MSKIGLIDVGGGLRDIFGAGVFDYLIEKNIIIDFLVGISAGSGNIITYMSKQYKRNYKSYMEFSKRKEYMSWKNYIKDKNYVGLDYIYNVLSKEDGELPFDYDTYKNSKSNFVIVATDADTGKPVYFNKKDITKDKYDICAASSTLPVLNKPYKINNKYYFDGSISDPIPIEKCEEEKCDKIIIILTRPLNYRKSDGNKKILYRNIKREYPNFYNVLIDRCNIYNNKLETIIENYDNDKLLIISPDETTGLKTLTKDYKKLDELYKNGYNKGKIIEDFINKKSKKKVNK